jgi:hypothetical protein
VRKVNAWSLEHHVSNSYFLNRIVVGAVQTGSTRHDLHFWPIVPAPGDCEDGEFAGMKIGRGNRSTRRKPAPAPLCPPQIPLDQTLARTLTAAVESQRLTAWAMAQPSQVPSSVSSSRTASVSNWNHQSLVLCLLIKITITKVYMFNDTKCF